MNLNFKLAAACSACLILVGCNPPAQDQQGDNPAQTVDDGGTGEEIVREPAQEAAELSSPPEFVQALWERSVDIAKPCENAASVLADRLAFTSPQNAKPEAQRGLRTCENALEKQNALSVPAEADGELAVTLDAAIHECREALDARRKFFEASVAVLEGDTTRWRTSLVKTASDMAQWRSEECIARFRTAGIEI